MKDRNLVRVRHIQDAIEEIEEFVEGMTMEAFLQDKKTNRAVVYQMQIIGEALSHIDDDFRGMHLDVPKSQIIGMRNIIVHEYFEVNLKRVWQTIQNDLPKLKEQTTKCTEKLRQNQLKESFQRAAQDEEVLGM